MLIHLEVGENRTSWAGQTPRTVNYTVSNFLFIRLCWECIISSMNVLLWKRWEELDKRFLPCLGLFAPTLETQLSCFWNPQSIFIVFFPISFQFIATSCCLFLVLFSQKRNKAVKQNSHFTQQTFLVHQLNTRCSWLLQKERKQIETAQHIATFFLGIKTKTLVSKVRVGGL